MFSNPYPRFIVSLLLAVVYLSFGGLGRAQTSQLLTWDTGTAAVGTAPVNQPSTAAGLYYYKIVARSTAVWRTRLTVASGEANMWLHRGAIPAPLTSASYSASQVGSDGILLSPELFAAGQEWFIIVQATGPSSTWKLASGEAYVRNLGNLPFTDTNNNGSYNLGEPVQDGGVANQVMDPEGVAFFRVTLPANTPAWALWAAGGNNLIGVRKNQVPLLFAPSLLADRKQASSLLLVPPYLGLGVDSYFVSMKGAPGSMYSLDSRIQTVENMAFDGATAPITPTTSPYRVFSVEVPAEQVIWDLSLERINGDPNFAVRKQFIPSEFENDAYSEVAGAVNDSLTLVAPELTNGIWYVTLYGADSYEARLRSGTPVITDVAYRDLITNDATTRVGWRYYRVPNITSQLGTLGWQLTLADAPIKTELAIRRALPPGRWDKRTGGTGGKSTVAVSDFSSTNGVLQEVDHEADIWFIGVNQALLPLGAFRLTLDDIRAKPASLDNLNELVTDQLESTWNYYRIEVPANSNLLGWHLHLSEIMGAPLPKISVRRDRLPPKQGAGSVGAGQNNWPSGATWDQTMDFTGVSKNNDGKDVTGQQFFAAKGQDRPLEAGTYFVGVLAGTATAVASTATVSYRIQSRGIGSGYAIPVTPLDYATANTVINNLAPREFRIFSFTIPAAANLASWELGLANGPQGETMFQIRRDTIPDFFASTQLGTSSEAAAPTILGGKRLARQGSENLIVFPTQGQTTVTPGTYYVTVVGQGIAPTTTLLGADPASATLSARTPYPVTNLGTISPTATVLPIDLGAAAIAVYQFSVPAGAAMVEAWLSEREGNPGLSLMRGTSVPKPWSGDLAGTNGYGYSGGQNSLKHPVLLYIQEPAADVYTLTVRANGASASTLNSAKASLNLRITNFGAWPTISCGATNSTQVTGQIAEAWRYFTLTVPENAAIKGIQIKLANITSGNPTLVIKRGTSLPKTLTSDVTTEEPWPDNGQLYPGYAYTKVPKDATGRDLKGRSYVSAYGAPMGPGTYTIGVTKNTEINTVSSPNTPPMSYQLTVRCIGEGPGFELPIETISHQNGTTPYLITALPADETKFYKVVVPPGLPSWRVHLEETITAGGTPGQDTVQDGSFSIRKDQIPSYTAAGNPEGIPGATVTIYGGAERWVLLPTTTNAQLEGGTYYIAATALGADGTDTILGAAPCDLKLFTPGPMPVSPLPALNQGAAINTAVEAPFDLGPAESTAFEFTVPARPAPLKPYGFNMLIHRDVGASNFSARLETPANRSLPRPPLPGVVGFFGGVASEFNSTYTDGGKIIYEATPGVYRVIVRSTEFATFYSDAKGKISVQLFDSDSIPTLPFDGGSLDFAGIGPNTNILPIRVVIPDTPNWQAWGVRLTGDIEGKPIMYIRRDEPVVGTASTTGLNSDATDWPTLAQWTQPRDYTELTKDRQGSATGLEDDRTNHFFVAARNRPLVPGTYYIGIDNRGNTVLPRTFTIKSFAFGAGHTIPVTALATGATMPVAIAEPRIPQVFKFTVPAETRAWVLQVADITGDTLLVVRKDFIPDPVKDLTYPDKAGGIHLQKNGDERFTLLPQKDNDFIPAGDYYAAVVSEGQNPPLAGYIGSGPVEGTITNVGPQVVEPLGLVSSTVINKQVNLGAMEIRYYTVEVPAGLNNIQFRLNERSGNAKLTVARGTKLPTPFTNSYGIYGGQASPSPIHADGIINLGNPAADTYTIAVHAFGTAASFVPAAARLSIEITRPSPLNFSDTFNLQNGLLHIAERSLIDKEKHFYQVTIPAKLGEEEVLGWLVTILQGAPTVSFYKSEADFGKAPALLMKGRSALLVPPFLTKDTNWFIDVEGVGNTDYIIKSQPVTLTSAPWLMPTEFNRAVGDSSEGLPSDIGIGRDLGQDLWEFYATDVPEGNLGLLRVTLESLNGNPNVFIRRNGIPTTDHNTAGAGSPSLIDFSLEGEESEAGNFSELSTATTKPTQLKPGRYYIGVKSDATGINRNSSKYRLRVHSGVVADLSLDTLSPLTGQNLAQKDWRYYRVRIPRTGVPATWQPFFNRINGTSQLYIRDTIPPFSMETTFVDWQTDAKNQVTAGSYLRKPAPGTVNLPVPPLRPGATYFLGFYGDTGSTFDVSSASSLSQLVIDQELPFDTGNLVATVNPGTTKLYRIPVPVEASRFKMTVTNSAPGQSIKLEQGTPPSTTITQAAHRNNVTPFPVSFPVNDLLATTWPMIPNQDYYLRLTNTTTSPLTSTIVLNGKTLLTEDEDNDMLRDVWERQYFTNLAQLPGADPDGDGSSNLDEQTNGTNPTDRTSVFYTVVVSAAGGTFTVSPQQALYAPNTMVTLTATASPGDSFRTWLSSTAGISNATTPTVTVTITGNINAKAVFTMPFARSVDTPADIVWTASGNKAWFGEYESNHDGTDAASTPAGLLLNQSARTSTTITGPGTLSWWWRVSSRTDGGILEFYRNGTQVTKISGSIGWTRVTQAIPAGNHTIEWRYYKAIAAISGEDRGQLDEVSFSGAGTPTTNYSSWVTALFSGVEISNPAVSGPTADPDRDGVPNAVEAALGTSPKSGASTDAPLVLTQHSVLADNRTITLEMLRSAPGYNDITLQLQACTDSLQGPWVILAEKIGTSAWVPTVPTATITEGAVNPQGLVPVSIRDIIPTTGTSKRYYRLRALVP